MTGIFRGTGTSGTGVAQPDVLTRVAIAGDTMTGYLNVPAGATGTQVPQRQEIDTALALKANLISPVLVTPNLGTPSAGVLTNCTGTAAGLTTGGNALLAGSATQVFSVANGTGSQAINKTQADSTYAALAGLNTQVFSVATATVAAHAVRADQIVGILSAQSMVRLNTANGYGSTNTMIRRFTNVTTNQGSDITYADSATLGASFTINANGVYGISFYDNFNAAGNVGISINSTQLTISVVNINVTDRLTVDTTSAANFIACAAISLYLPSGTVVRAHTDGVATGTNPTGFSITRVS